MNMLYMLYESYNYMNFHHMFLYCVRLCFIPAVTCQDIGRCNIWLVLELDKELFNIEQR